MFKLILIFVAFQAVIGSSVSKLNIVGGNEIDISRVPYVVSLQQYNTHVCGASLISRNVILTNANCVDVGSQLPYMALGIRAGSNSRSSGGQFILISRILLHPLYNGLENDIALAWLESPVNISHAAPITLPKSDRTYLENEVATVVGWGATSQQTALASPNLRGIAINVTSKDVCNKRFYETNLVFCAGGDINKQTCQFDNGGPASIKNELAGIIYGTTCTNPGQSDIFVNIPAYRDWIKSNSGI